MYIGRWGMTESSVISIFSILYNKLIQGDLLNTAHFIMVVVFKNRTHYNASMVT